MFGIFNQNSSNQGLDLTKEIFGIGKSNETNHSVEKKYCKKICREDVIEIADFVFENRKIAKHTYTVSRNLSFSAYNETNDDHTTDVTDDIFEITNYVFCNDESLQLLLTNKNNIDLEEVVYNSQLEKIDTNNIVFVIKDFTDLEKLRSTLENSEYDLDSYNFKCSFVEDNLDEKLFVEIFSEHYNSCNIYRITKNHALEDGGNPILSLIGEDGTEFKFAYQNTITIISAQTGNFKSTILNQIADALANSNQNLGMKCNANDGIVLFIDTESVKAVIAKRYLNDSNEIAYFSFKSLEMNRMLEMTKSIILRYISEKRKIKALFIDSCIDYVEDFNNNPESALFLKLLEIITEEFQIPIFISCQENLQRSGNYSSKASGHLGSKLIQKSEAYYSIKKTNNGAELKCLKNRNDQLFTLDFEVKLKNDYVYLVSKGVRKSGLSSIMKKEEKFREAIEVIFSKNEIISNAELVILLMDLLEIKDRSAKTYKKKAETEGLIVVADKKGKVKYWKKG